MNRNIVDLFWYGLERAKRYDASVGQLPSYIFGTSTGNEPFIDASIRIAKLNNYILRVRDIKDWNDEDDPTAEEAIDASGLDFEDAFDRDIHIYFADHLEIEMSDFVELAQAASSMVMLYFLFISILKEVCDWSEPSLYRDKNRSGLFRKDEMGTILDILDRNTSGKVRSQLYAGRIEYIMNAVKKIRNDYAHGDWQGVAEKIKTIGMKRAFEGVSEFLLGLEKIVNQNKDDPVVKKSILS